MGVFNISRDLPLFCHLTQESYCGEQPNPVIPAMVFFDCNFAKERLALMDQIVLSGWYQEHLGRMTLETVRERFGMSDQLFREVQSSKCLLSSDGKLNIEGLHGGERRSMSMRRTYSQDCPVCRGRGQLVHSVALNRMLKFGRVEVTKWEIVEMKLQEVADFAAPLVEAGEALWGAFLKKGEQRIGEVRRCLHAMDHYVEKFEENVQVILLLSLILKGTCMAYEKLGLKFLKGLHERITTQVNTFLVIGSILFVWKGVIRTFDREPGELLLVGTLLFFIYLLGLSGTVKLLVGAYCVHLVMQLFETRNELVQAGEGE
ncbi:MAG: hypothetical protein KDK64_03950 [Chlamydiia bacterium]|nr:hypothetical protein [Chlamydiia bacterium]